MKILDLPISTLAYIGDAVYELEIRLAILRTHQAKAGAVHKEVIQLVNATAQAEALERIYPILSGFESSLVKRASNHSVPQARNVDPTEYRKATGFESLIGYVYLANKEDRLLAILKRAQPDLIFGKMQKFGEDFETRQ